MSRFERVSPLPAALAFLVLMVAGFLIVGETPGSDDSAAKILSFYNDNETETYIGSALITLGGIALVWFAASLRTHIHTREGGAGRLASLPLAAATIIAVGITILAGLEVTAADVAGDVPASVLQTINALDNNMYFTAAAGTLLMYLAIAAASFRLGVFPKWVGGLAAILAVVSLTPAGFFAFLISGLFYPLLGVLIYRDHDAATGTGTVTT